MKIKKIGAAINAGCEIDGAQYCVDREADFIDFDVVVKQNETLPDEVPSMLRHAEVLNFDQRLNKEVKLAFAEGSFPLVFGGDHSLAIGSISARDNQNRAIIWIDAHSDINTAETSTSRRIHGMPVAFLCGQGDLPFDTLVDGHRLPFENVQYFGLRSVDPLELVSLREHDMAAIWMDDIRERGYKATIAEVLKFTEKFPEIHISFDLDGLDPQIASGVSTPVKDGLKKEETFELIRALLATGKVSSMDIVEYNPLNDDGQTIGIVLDTIDIVEAYIK